VKTKPIFPLPARTPNPLPFKKALRLVFGGRHVDDRIRMFRRFWFALTRKPQHPWRWFDPSLTAEKAVERFKDTGVLHRVLYDWWQLVPEWRAEHQNDANRRNAELRWSKTPIDKRPARRK
jgi:hypothetical protein